MLTAKVVTPTEVMMRDINPEIAEAIIASISDRIIASDYDTTYDRTFSFETMSICITMKEIFERLKHYGYSRPNNYMKYLEIITRLNGPFHKAGWKVTRSGYDEDTYFVFSDSWKSTRN